MADSYLLLASSWFRGMWRLINTHIVTEESRPTLFLTDLSHLWKRITCLTFALLRIKLQTEKRSQSSRYWQLKSWCTGEELSFPFLEKRRKVCTYMNTLSFTVQTGINSLSTVKTSFSQEWNTSCYLYFYKMRHHLSLTV